jgi:peptidoglycan hydrolase CwlO-like protein
MEQKIKFILIGLLGALAISVFFIFQFYTAKLRAEKERDRLISENETWQKRAQESLQKVSGLEDKISSLNRELDKTIKDKLDIERKLELANREKQELIEKIKSRLLQPVVEAKPKEQPVAEMTPQATDAYWASILKAKTDLEFQISSLRNELKNIQITNEQLQREKSALDLDINSLRRDKEDLKRQLEYNQKVLDSISQELVREKNDKIQIEDDLKPIRNENVMLRRQLNTLNSQKINLDRKLEQLKQEEAALEDKLQNLGATLKENVGTAPNQVVKELPREKKEYVELPPIIVRPPAEPGLTGTTAKPEGSVLAINQENNFVIISLGLDTGLKIGDALEVYREGKSIATLEVIQARNNISACDIKKGIIPLKIGDMVK